ncbi:MAG TPA: homocysteine S-methyltransferase [Woeseiaceae bacterium]|nr:homocysteine S-methyltransferase [Woeseiaceae bacterium]
MTTPQSTLFEHALANRRPVRLDGGLATELEAQGHDIGTHLWSAALLKSDPAAIVAAHRAFLEAGADVIISASYQASVEGFATLGVGERDAEALIASSVDLALTARRQYLEAHPERQRRPMVAASVGPYGAALHDGSEYSGDYDVDDAGLRAFHERRLSLLDLTDADLLACETIPNRREAAVLCDLLAHARLPAWVSFCCRDERCISDGTPLREVCALFRDHPRVLALGVNCTAPGYVSSLIGEIRAAAPAKAVVVYPNSGETYDSATNAWSGDASTAACADFARDWHAAGARLIGGCCRIGPRQIAAMHHGLPG